MIEVREVLRAWLVGRGAAHGGRAGGGGPQDRAALRGARGRGGAGPRRWRGQLTDEVIGQVVAAVRPAPPERARRGVGAADGAARSRSARGSARA